MNAASCPRCGKRIPVDTSRRSGDVQVRYHKCKCGGERTTVVPRSEIWTRQPGQRKVV